MQDAAGQLVDAAAVAALHRACRDEPRLRWGQREGVPLGEVFDRRARIRPVSRSARCGRRLRTPLAARATGAPGGQSEARCGVRPRGRPWSLAIAAVLLVLATLGAVAAASPARPPTPTDPSLEQAASTTTVDDHCCSLPPARRRVGARVLLCANCESEAAVKQDACSSSQAVVCQRRWHAWRHRLTPASRPESMWAVQSGQRRTR